MEATPPHSWVKQISKKTGRPYWFNTKTGASVWEEPPEFSSTRQHANQVQTATQQSSSTITNQRPSIPLTDAVRKSDGQHIKIAPSQSNRHPVAAASDATGRPVQFSVTDPRAFAGANIAVLAAGEHVPSYRAAAEAICQQLSKGENTLAAAPGVHRFPPHDNKALKFVITDLADEYELGCDTVGDGELRHVAVWRAGCEPPEAVSAAEEEARLEQEAAERRKKEAATEAAAAAARARAMLEQSAADAASGGPNHDHAGGAGSRPDVGETVAVKPLFQRKDKRSIAEIQAELRAKKQRMAQDVLEGLEGDYADEDNGGDGGGWNEA